MNRGKRIAVSGWWLVPRDLPASCDRSRVSLAPKSSSDLVCVISDYPLTTKH
jgi:hypothetical protein